MVKEPHKFKNYLVLYWVLFALLVVWLISKPRQSNPTTEQRIDLFQKERGNATNQFIPSYDLRYRIGDPPERYNFPTNEWNQPTVEEINGYWIVRFKRRSQ